LSGIPGERITPKESDEYYSASRKYLEVNKNVKLIPWDVQNQRYRDIRAAASKSVERYYERMGETWNRKEQLFIGNFLNDYVSYSLAPFASLLSAVNEIISDNSSNRVIILYRKSRESQPPLFGIPTKENPRGVPELLESRVGAYLKGSGLPANVEFIEIGLGLTFADVLRRAAFQILGGLFAIRNLLRLFNFERKVQSNRDKVKAISDSPLLTIVRNERQADYFEILVNEGLEAKALYLPQLMLRSQHIKTEMLSFYDHGGSVATTIWNSTLFLCRWFVNRAITYLRH